MVCRRTRSFFVMNALNRDALLWCSELSVCLQFWIETTLHPKQCRPVWSVTLFFHHLRPKRFPHTFFSSDIYHKTSSLSFLHLSLMSSFISLGPLQKDDFSLSFYSMTMTMAKRRAKYWKRRSTKNLIIAHARLYSWPQNSQNAWLDGVLLRWFS